jgi:hypothetical protein
MRMGKEADKLPCAQREGSINNEGEPLRIMLPLPSAEVLKILVLRKSGNKPGFLTRRSCFGKPYWIARRDSE